MSLGPVVVCVCVRVCAAKRYGRVSCDLFAGTNDESKMEPTVWFHF